MPEAAPAESRSAGELAPGVQHAFDFCIDDADMLRYAELSGDRNPLHLDADFARSRGFRDRVVYGGLLIAQVSRMIGMHLPGRDAIWNGLRIDFRGPLYVGETARLEAEITHHSEAVRALELRFRLSREAETSEILAQGRASVSLSA